MKTSYMVMKTNEFDKSVFYRVACSCTDQEHDIVFEMEDQDGIIYLNFYGRLFLSL